MVLRIRTGPFEYSRTAKVQRGKWEKRYDTYFMR